MPWALETRGADRQAAEENLFGVKKRRVGTCAEFTAKGFELLRLQMASADEGVGQRRVFPDSDLAQTGQHLLLRNEPFLDGKLGQSMVVSARHGAVDAPARCRSAADPGAAARANAEDREHPPSGSGSGLFSGRSGFDRGTSELTGFRKGTRAHA
jgi:hypothetical protein